MDLITEKLLMISFFILIYLYDWCAFRFIYRFIGTGKRDYSNYASGLINGVATILFIIFIDPKISILADDVIIQRGSHLTTL